MSDPNPITDQQLNEYEALADAATPGPWGTYDDETGLIDIAADLTDTGHGYQCRRYIGQFEADQIDNDPTHRDWTEEQDRAQVAADAAYIAAMNPEVAKALITEVRRLRAELADFSGRVNELESKLCDCEPVREHDDYKRPAFYQHEAHCPVVELDHADTQPATEGRTLTEAEHNRAWHAIEGAAGEEGADPGTVLNAVLRALDIDPPVEETHVVADDSDDPEHIDDCPGCEPRPAVRPAVETGA